METLRSVFVLFPTPKEHTNKHTNAKGPITGIELMTSTKVKKGKTPIEVIYWADDGLGDEGGGPTSFGSLVDLCKEYDFDFNEVAQMICTDFANRVGPKAMLVVAMVAISQVKAPEAMDRISRAFVEMVGTDL